MEVTFTDVCFSYDDKKIKNPTYALKNINVELESNKIHGVIGPIGSGKTTFLELMNGITKPTKGTVKVGEYILTSKRNNFNFNKFRKEVGLVYQFPEKQFFCATVGEEISFSIKNLNKKHSGLKSKITKVLKMVGLDETYIYRSPFMLNGGEKRRVAIASVLISNPKLLILDEPTIGLDQKSKKLLMRLLKTLKTKYNKTIIIVSHDVDMLFDITDDIVVLNNGELVMHGSKLDVFKKVEILDKNNCPVPSIIRFEKVLFDKTGVDLGYCESMNTLVRRIEKKVSKDE